MLNSKGFFYVLILILFSTILLNAANLDNIDKLYNLGKYKDGLKAFEEKFDASKSDAEIIWRLARFYYEIADAMSNSDKKEKIKKFTEGMKKTEPYLDIKKGNAEARAKVVFWYAALYGARGETIGIKESLDIIPDLFDLANKSISIDPQFASPYLLKGRIDKAVPFFLGGNKFRMGINFSKAIEYDPTNLNILVDAAYAFYGRNWDAKKKLKYAEKKGKEDGTPQNIEDRIHVKQLLDKSIKLYKDIKEPTARQTKKYNEALKLLKKYD